MKSSKSSRRWFLTTAFGIGAMVATWPLKVAAAVQKKKRLVAVKLSTLAELEKVGGHLNIELKGTPLILIRRDQKKIAAFSPVCSHQACAVTYKAETGAFQCACHDSRFDKDGHPQSGPATRPLTRFATAVKDGKLIIQLPDASE